MEEQQALQEAALDGAEVTTIAKMIMNMVWPSNTVVSLFGPKGICSRKAEFNTVRLDIAIG